MSNLDFVYSPKVQAFLADRIDENPEYSKSTKVFEYMISRNWRFGHPVSKGIPISIRMFITKVPTIEDLAFFYTYESRKKTGETIRVIDVDFVKNLPL